MSNLQKATSTIIDKLKTDFSALFQDKSASVSELLVTNKEQYDNAIKEGAQLNKMVKELDKKRKELLEPMKDATLSINALCKELSKDAFPAMEKVQARAQAWQSKETARLAAEQRKLEEIARKRDAEIERLRQEELKNLEDEKKAREENSDMFGLPADTSDINEAHDNLIDDVSEMRNESRMHLAIDSKAIKKEIPKNVRKTWTFEVLDESAVPKSFFRIDEKLIKAAVAEGARNIEGVKIYQKETIVLR